MAQYFITRPIAAIVIALLTVIAGLLALTALPISQYPDVVPPQVVVTAIDPQTKQPKKDQLTLSNYGRINVKDDLARVAGVGDVLIFGEREYSIRVWLDPAKMNDFSLSVDDVTRAIQAQNLSVASGQ